MIIEKARPNDLEKLRNISNKSFEKKDIKLEKYIKNDFFVIKDKKIIGFFIIKNKRLYFIAVDKKYRGRGIGSFAMKFIKRKYKYDSYGNLITVSRLVYEDDPENSGYPRYEKTSYLYDDYTCEPADHYITDIKDDRGLSPIRYVYDENNRLIATIDAKDNRIELRHEITADGKTEIVTDRLGNEKLYSYDNQGRVTSIVDSASGATAKRLPFRAESLFPRASGLPP